MTEPTKNSMEYLDYIEYQNRTCCSAHPNCIHKPEEARPNGLDDLKVKFIKEFSGLNVGCSEIQLRDTIYLKKMLDMLDEASTFGTTPKTKIPSLEEIETELVQSSYDGIKGRYVYLGDALNIVHRLLTNGEVVSVEEIEDIIKYQKYKGDSGLAKAIHQRLTQGK